MVPSYGSTLGFLLWVPPQGLTLGSHPRVFSPLSHLRVLGPTFLICLKIPLQYCCSFDININVCSVDNLQRQFFYFLIDAKDNFIRHGNDVVDSLNSPYDFRSIMHYKGTTFAKHGKLAITTIDPSKQALIGQRKGFSKIDLEQINKLYKCDGM